MKADGEASSMTKNFLTWDQAVLHILEEARQPLHYIDVSDRIVAQRLTRSFGATPANTTNATLSRLIEKGRVTKIRPGLFALSTNVGKGVQEEQGDVEWTDPDARPLTVNAYGLNWKRDLVDWAAKGNGCLWDHAGGTDVDFADQDGIYLLLSGNEVVYVGQSRTLQSPAGLYNRLKSHHTDFRRTTRWDSFSWFGFRPVDSESGDLLQALEIATIDDVINIIEAIFIEGLMPRLNMCRGEGTKEWLEANQYFQREDPALLERQVKALMEAGRAIR